MKLRAKMNQFRSGRTGGGSNHKRRRCTCRRIGWQRVERAERSCKRETQGSAPKSKQLWKQLDYRTNRRAQNLAKNITPVLSFILSNRDLHDPFHSRILEGVSRYCDTKDFTSSSPSSPMVLICQRKAFRCRPLCAHMAWQSAWFLLERTIRI